MEQNRILIDAIESLSLARDLSTVTMLVSHAARELTSADGASFILRDGDLCYYADEDAVAPLWKGLRFPMDNCVSGWSMTYGKSVVIPDIYEDKRVPHDAYRPTFVKSMCMVPIRPEDPLGAVGAYWSKPYLPEADEVRHLQILANSASSALNNLYLRETVSQAHSVEETLRSRNVELETAIHTLVHDLRGPLSKIMLYSELLQDEFGEWEQAKVQNVQRILLSCMNMNEQMERMLTLFRIGSRRLRKQRVDLSSIASEVASAISIREPSRHVDFDIEQPLFAYADPYLARIVVENLFSNAWKYTSKKPSARIEFGKKSEDPKGATFFVRDNGDGFDSDKASSLFRPLVRLHEATDFPGTGLGLASVARVVEVHGGQVSAEGMKSEGATFYFSLPTSEI